MTVHTREELDRLNRAARREFSHALMSDTKWRKLFATLENPAFGLCQVRVKFIEILEPKPIALPTIGMAHTPRPYVDTIEFGPLEFRAIEWLEIPAVADFPRLNNVPSRKVPQDLDLLADGLNATGTFPIERSTESLRVVGYRR